MATNSCIHELAPPSRCVIVVDAALPPGRAANAAAVLALTLGKRHPHLVGADITNADGDVHFGLVVDDACRA